MKQDARIGEIHNEIFDDTPITMTRNLAVERAKLKRADILLMIDSDMAPDICLDTSTRPAMHAMKHARPFWDSSFDHMIKHHGPCLIASPYCGPPPHENIFVFYWDNKQSNHPNVDMRMEQFTRESAAQRLGFEEVAALPTGLMIIDMRIFDEPTFAPPYFKYEFSDKFETRKGTTEDCYFTRNASLSGFKVYCNWSAWSGHVKRKVVCPPTMLTPDSVRKDFREAVKSNLLRSNETLLFLKSREPFVQCPSKQQLELQSVNGDTAEMVEKLS
jgi:hypothetical protein